jgi:hypothetical protein
MQEKVGIEGEFRLADICMSDRHKLHLKSLHSVENAQKEVEESRSLLKGSTEQLTLLENKMVQTLSDQNSSDLDTQKIEHQILQTHKSIHYKVGRSNVSSACVPKR